MDKRVIYALFNKIRAGLKFRSLDAASGGRRWRDDRRSSENASIIHGGAAIVAARAAHFVNNVNTGVNFHHSPE